MHQDRMIEELERHPFLHGLSRQQIEGLGGSAERVGVESNDFLVREMQVADAFYLIQSGRVAIEVNRHGQGPVRLQTVGPGEVVGWSWLLAPYRWQFDARALDPVVVLTLNAEELRWKCKHDHELGYEVLSRLVGVLGHRLAAARMQILELSS